MAELVEGQRYGLSSNTEGDKTIIHLKLTDSALKTLEEYAKQKASDFEFFCRIFHVRFVFVCRSSYVASSFRVIWSTGFDFG